MIAFEIGQYWCCWVLVLAVLFGFLSVVKETSELFVCEYSLFPALRLRTCSLELEGACLWRIVCGAVQVAKRVIIFDV